MLHKNAHYFYLFLYLLFGIMPLLFSFLSPFIHNHILDSLARVSADAIQYFHLDIVIFFWHFSKYFPFLECSCSSFSNIWGSHYSPHLAKISFLQVLLQRHKILGLNACWKKLLIPVIDTVKPPFKISFESVGFIHKISENIKKWYLKTEMFTWTTGTET
jgi:hypothetical protein